MTTTITPVTTGTDVLRMATHARRQHGHLGGLARELHTGIDQLESFIDGGTLPATMLQALAAELFNGATFDAASNRLRTAFKHEPKSYITPPLIDHKVLPRHKAGAAPAQTGYGDTYTAPHKRAGWE